MKANAPILLVFLAFFFPALAKGQVTPGLPFTFNSAGGYGTVNGFLIDFNLGELVLVETFDQSPGLLFSQGFLQPYLLAPAPVNDVFVTNNILTPNNDGKNDLLEIKGLENYPNNTLSIYDRAGRKVFSTTDYKSNWNGMVDGKALHEDTYYYILDLGKSRAKITGFVSIVRDGY
ncbi:gliding motility-associated C-terminal domain-containing protein [Pedobacter sp.]|uniref:gliding motility-associated C-terminal domain-containing protein n=1 Tax=Pedobacter sp. TaxID=1411316 RepID=UPI003BAAB122